MALLNSTTNTL